MSSAEKPKVEKVPWLWLIIYVVILAVVGQILTHFEPMPYCVSQALGAGGGGMAFNLMAYVYGALILIISLVYPALRRVDLKTLTYFYIATLIATLYTSYFGVVHETVALTHARLVNPTIHGIFLPYWWMPEADIIRMSFYGGAPVPWAEWMPVIANWWLVLLLGSFFFYAWVILFIRQWIDVEALSFPQAIAGWTLLQAMGGTEKPELRRRRRLVLIGTLVSFLVYLPYVIVSLYPPFPDLYGWLKHPAFCTWFTGAFDIQALFPGLASVIVYLGYGNANPLFYGLAFLAPLDTLFSAAFGYLVLMILLPQLLYYMGYYGGILALGSWGRWWQILCNPPLKLNFFAFQGLLPAIVIFDIAISWKHLRNTFVSALRGRDEMASLYRIAYAIIIIGTIAWIAYFMANGIGAAASVVLFLALWLHTAAYARMHAHTGFITITDWELSPWFLPVWGRLTANTQETMMALTFANRVLWCDGGFGKNMGPAMFGADAFKIGRLAGIDEKTTFKIIALTTILTTFITVPVMVWCWYYFGLMKLPLSKEWDFMWTGEYGRYNSWAVDTWPWWPQALAGFVVGIVLCLARMRFVWWPLEPIGLFVGIAGLNPQGYGIPFLLTITLIVKYIVIKVGGARVYEEYGVPIASGIVAGSCLGTLLIVLGAIYRFYFPY